MIAQTKQSWGKRTHLTRRQVMGIHASHDAAFWLSLAMSGSIVFVATLVGVPAVSTMPLFAVALAFSAIVTGLVVDLTSMRIPDRISAAVALSGAIWLAAEGFGITPAEGQGSARQVLGLILPDQGEGPLIGSLDNWFTGAWLVTDIALTIAVFAILYLSFAKGFGFGGGDVKVMTAFTLFLGFPLGLDFLVATYFFGGFIAIAVSAVRLMAKAAIRLGSTSVVLTKMSGVRSFPYAPAIFLSAIICLVHKSEGFFL